MEWATGKRRLMRVVRRFEARGVPTGPDFFPAALDLMGIEIDVPALEIARVPRHGPLVVVANHPHGLVDGMVLAAIVGRRRTDYRILTRSLLTKVPEIADHTIPVPFPNARGAAAANLEVRRRAMAHLARGGSVILFPAGGVAVAERAFGPAIEPPWSPFTAKLIRRSGASVLPVRFPGQNSRAYQIAHRISPLLRQGLLLHEVAHALNRPQRPVIGALIPPGAQHRSAAWLRAHTLSLTAGRAYP